MRTDKMVAGLKKNLNFPALLLERLSFKDEKEEEKKIQIEVVASNVSFMEKK